MVSIIFVQGSIHQGSYVFSALSRGRQCAYIAFYSLLFEMTLPVQAWTPEFIDQILIGGDRMCLHALTHKLIPDTSTLLVTHLPALAYSAQHTLLRVTYDPSYHWSCWRSFETEPPFWSLKDALTNSFFHDMLYVF